MCAPTLPASVSTPQSSVSPTIPPRVLTHSASHQSGRSPPGPTERPGRQPQRDGQEQADRARAERPHRGQHRAQHQDRARATSADRHEVVPGAEQPAQAFDGLRAGAPAVPAEVDEEARRTGRGRRGRGRSGRAGAARAWAGESSARSAGRARRLAGRLLRAASGPAPFDARGRTPARQRGSNSSTSSRGCSRVVGPCWPIAPDSLAAVGLALPARRRSVPSAW